MSHDSEQNDLFYRAGKAQFIGDNLKDGVKPFLMQQVGILKKRVFLFFL